MVATTGIEPVLPTMSKLCFPIKLSGCRVYLSIFDQAVNISFIFHGVNQTVDKLK